MSPVLPQPRRQALWLVFASFLLGFAYPQVNAAPVLFTEGPLPLDLVRHEMLPLSFASEPSTTDSVHAYWRFYGLDVPNVKHYFGTLDRVGGRLAVHVFVPPAPTATVVLVHGYYDHTGVWRHLIPPLLERRFAVIAYDQPGHGLSDGARADIASFTDYDTAFDDILAFSRQHLPSPCHVIAHSMGAGVTLSRLIETPRGDIGHVVLLAPLIRSAHWVVSGIGNTVASWFTKSLPRIYRNNSADSEYRCFVRNDPLQYNRIPTAWIKAHRDWVAKIERVKPTLRPVSVLQGKNDSTVDWKSNLAWIRRVFPRATITLIPGAGHQLMNEGDTARSKAISLVLQALAESPTPSCSTNTLASH